MQYTDFIRETCPIGGEWVGADGGGRIAVTDPATGETIAHVPDMGSAETKRAIAAAEAAMPEWRAKTAGERSAILRRLFELMMEHSQALGELLSREQGKPMAEAVGEIGYSASFIEWFAEEGKRAYGEIIPPHDADKRILTYRQPVGVVGAITPWNFPSAMIGRKLGPALAAGCTFVLKPASQTPLSALALAVLAEKAGVPAGVFNVVTGSASAIGGALTQSRTVRKISFTGSTEVGRELMRQSADSIKKMSLELGGNAPFLVFDDADLDAAVDGAIASKFRNGGQTCVCTNRFYVQDGIYDTFADRLVERVRAMTIGRGIDDGVDIGPMIDEKALSKINEHLGDAREKGATVLIGGKQPDLGGTWFEPTVLSDVTQDMQITRDETFGPVAGLVRFTDEADAIRWANDTEFGLASYVYTRDLSRMFRVSEALEAGMVGVNTGLISTAVAPFGGVKQSGLGREGSSHGLDDYLEIKYVCIGL
ncbi:NAD-dependent succinate-semialdehyde dehydrogenase [Croceicoccus sp. YJ47]|uniref:NAD-dependent succinate-semialdehyde dehydrogenase n=1 Tax=Croceicoccus sp. YJ47 TaxID=2798724 RepID=UPI001920A2F5|nr:NAD-dependent succinate-semialdehyde dehydrogenase [Croceicoccus sp. YJ47]QQN75387.1 NAD-dependent succinate-semialdehyde dehydrogenase [Croceicoccus sp. YJ47]